MEKKYSQGKWVINSQRNLIMCGKKWIADLIPDGFEPVPQEEEEANAKLIATAPELLKILEENLLFLNAMKKRIEDKKGNFDEWVKRQQLEAQITYIENIIKKATE